MSHIAAYPQTHRFWGLISAVLFILTIPLGNWVVMNVGLVGLMAPSAVLLAGLALVLRDAVHHCLGTRWAFYCILAGTALSGFLSDASLVIASCAAFLFSETADLIVYTPMRRRFPAWAIVASGFAGSVVDSVLFLSLAFGSLDYVAGQVIGKFEMSLLAALIIVTVRGLRRAPVQA